MMNRRSFLKAVAAAPIAAAALPSVTLPAAKRTASTTISRVTWTDGVSGTVINNARLQADIYDKIDAVMVARKA